MKKFSLIFLVLEKDHRIYFIQELNELRKKKNYLAEK